jgi:hypothetical protein
MLHPPLCSEHILLGDSAAVQQPGKEVRVAKEDYLPLVSREAVALLLG